jgi:hypothetical protein
LDERTIMGNAAIAEELPSSDELGEFYDLSASEPEPEDDDDDDDLDEDDEDEEMQPEDMPQG